MTQVLIIAGEASGDMYGAALAAELRRIDPDVTVWGCGGEKMRSAGVEIEYTTKEFAVLGFAEVVARIPFFIGALRRMKKLVENRRPDVIVPIDYPGFNLRLAEHCAAIGLPVAYYVSPQIWAWGRGRIHKIKKIVSRMLVTFPFEEELYRSHGVPVTFTGHPLVDIAKPTRTSPEFRETYRLREDVPLVGLFPGSRTHEVRDLLPEMVETVRRMWSEGREFEAIIGGAPTIDDELYEQSIAGTPIKVIRDETYNLLESSQFAIVASGTMTVEAACLGTPMVILYKVAPISWLLGRLLVRVPHIGMANLLAGERVVPEFLQGEATAENVLPIARKWFDHPEELQPIRKKLLAVREGLGTGNAARRAAEEVLATAERGR